MFFPMMTVAIAMDRKREGITQATDQPCIPVFQSKNKVISIRRYS